MKMKKRDVNFLIDNVENENLADILDEDTIGEIAAKVIHGFDIDDQSRSEWKEQTEEGIKIAEQITEDKNYPWENAANVKFPLIATSAIQFAARCYPSIIQGNQIVKAKIVGEDPDGTKVERGKRVADHMSYQLLEEMEEWEENTDQLFHSLPVVGTVFRKTFRDPVLRRPVSQLCMPLDVVVNMKTRSLATCRRISHLIPLHKNEVLERENSGVFLPKGANYMLDDADTDAEEIFIEQHRWLDLDGDGYEEPYIVTVHKDSATLVRIVANYEIEGIEVNSKDKVKKISAIQYFTAYFFIPSPSGKFYALGFAHLLGPINESMNTVINQLLDAGHMSNLGGGWIGRGARIRGGRVQFEPGEWKQVEVSGGMLKDNIVPLPVREPSNVLFQLLGLLNDTGMKLSSVSETMTGETPSQNTPATTTLAVLEQGLKVFTAIYKRIFRSLKQEFKKLYRLNGLYVDERHYYQVLDNQKQVFKTDYLLADLNIIPVADPTLASESQRLARVEALMGTFDKNPTPQGRGEILRQYYVGINAQHIEKLLPMDDKGTIQMPEPPPDPKIIETQIKAVESQAKTDKEVQLLPYEIAELQAKIEELKSKVLLNTAKANDMPFQTALATIQAQVAEMHGSMKLEIERLKTEVKNGETSGASQQGSGTQPGMGGSGNMVEPPADQGGVPVLGGMPESGTGGAGEGADALEAEL